MKYLKKFSESQISVGDKDTVNILQDICDLNFNESNVPKDFKVDMINQIKDLFYILEDEGNKVDMIYNVIQTNQGGGLKSLELTISKNGKNIPEYLELDYFNEFIDRCADIAVDNGFGISHIYPNRMFTGRNEYKIIFKKLSELSDTLRGDYQPENLPIFRF